MPLDLLLRYETWMILGLALIALDMLLGLDFFVLAFGVGALLTGTLLFTQFAASLGIADSWQGMITAFGLLSVLVLLPLRYWLNKTQKEGGKDINDY